MLILGPGTLVGTRVALFPGELIAATRIDPCVFNVWRFKLKPTGKALDID